ncbi:MAG TPA: response regulator [Chitinispirillaceae bacterium]|nr:response regulator [Chitinispirillaceae bacterium]
MMSADRFNVYSALDFAHTGMCIIDKDYNVIFWNKRLVEWTSINKDKIIGKNITQFCPALQERRNTIRVDQIFKGGPPVIFSSQIHKHLFPAPLANGDFRIQHITVSAIPSHAGTGYLALFAVEDVTELTLRMSELDKARHEAEMANRSKSEFLANMSHEIRTPMNGVLGMCNILLNSGLTEEQTKYAYMIDHSARTLLTVINDILDFSKIEAGKMTLKPALFDLKNCVEDVVQLLSFASEKKGLTLEYEYPDSLPKFFISDEGRVRQILINLINNAIKFTEKGGVTILVNSESSQDNRESIHICIKDTGIGIAEDIQTMLFNKFIQVDSSTTRKFQGTGLGLAISRQLALLMNGDITLKSTLGHGSEFTILLQLPKADSKQIEEFVSYKFRPDTPSSPTAFYNAHVLLAEDNQINQAVALHILERLQCTVIVVENGKEAVEILQNKKFDIVFMDCQMPILDGYSATRTIRNQEKNGQHVPIVAMTAHVIEGDRIKCIDSGMDDYISKPIDLNELIRILDNYCGHLKKPNTPSTKPSILIADENRIDNTDFSIDYRGLVESSFYGIGIFQNNRFIFSNAALSRIFGKNVNSILGVTIDELKEKIHEEDIPEFEKILSVNNTATSGTEREIIRFKTDHEEFLTLDIYTSIIQHKESTARLVLSTDLSCWINNAGFLAAITKTQPSDEVQHVTVDKKITIFDIPPTIVAVDDLMERLGTDEQFALELLIKFADSLPAELEELERALQQHEFSKIEITAHRIKGASRNLSICGLMETMDVIELAGRALNIETINDVFSEAQSQAEAFISAIKNFKEE